MKLMGKFITILFIMSLSTLIFVSCAKKDDDGGSTSTFTLKGSGTAN